MLPPMVEEREGDEAPGWFTRVVPNKYPILSGAGGELPADCLTSGYGRHEVIIETPRHDADLPDLDPAGMQAIVDTWRARFTAVSAMPGIEAVALFRNRGKGAGASVAHSHSQLVGMPFTPPLLAEGLERALAHYQEHRRCLTCEYLERELTAGDRVVEMGGTFAMLVPLAARGPLEQWIVPIRHSPDFAQGSEDERNVLGGVIQRAIRRLRKVVGDAAYNMVVEPGSSDPAHRPAAHWKIRLVPDLLTPGGFELLSGLAVVPSSPESDAESLRGVNPAA
ncbi:hypothetical protein MB02_08050 [Croceicoccus estronivorus]|nr:hypothetical protein MB02_08050 [Croceicoccus estronivorus]